MSEEELEYLHDLLKKIGEARDTLRFTYQKCVQTGKKDSYSQDEQDNFEALTSKFARLSDLILKKAIKTIDILDLDEVPETMRDAIARAEKKGLIDSETRFIEIRRIRNEIAHDYTNGINELQQIYAFVLDNTPELFNSVDRILAYCKKFK